MLIALVLILLNIFAWYPVLSFWFFKSWEQSWFIGLCGYDFGVICLMKGHGFLYLINYLLFGWNASGWYLTAMILHIIAVLLTYKVATIITNNKTLGFIIALLFGVNVAYNDVVNWGSFEGLYALLMVIFLLAILAYWKFRIGKGKKTVLWYALTIGLFIFGLFVRESALILPFFLFFFELLLQKFTFSKKYVVSLIKIFFLFGLLSLAYLAFRSWYGGAPHDEIDAMVQLRMTLISQHLYLEYIWRGLLAFGRFAASHLVPYPIVNEIRDGALKFLPTQLTMYYFFPLYGFLYVLLKILIIIYFFKQKTIRNILIFAFLWFLIPTVFYSFAFSITDNQLQQKYDWDSARWVYFSFFATVVFWVTVFWSLAQQVMKKHKKSAKKIQYAGVIAIILILCVNLYLLRAIQHDMYTKTFKPAKDFYTNFFKSFPTLPKDYVFYSYPFATPMSDYLSEWFYLRKVYYPYLTDNRNDWAEGHIGMLLERLQEKSAKLESTFFLDYNQTNGLMDKTKKAREVILNQKEYSYIVNEVIDHSLENKEKKEHDVTIKLDPPLHVEIPYVMELTVSANAKENTANELTAYVQDRIDFLNNAKVSVCRTVPIGSLSRPAMHLLPGNIIDGNIGLRSFWTADCRPAWVEIDLGRAKEIGALAFRSNPGESTNIPGDYYIETSLDGKTWEKIVDVLKNDAYQKIDVFPKIVTARYVRFTVVNTNRGSLLSLDELEVIGKDGVAIAASYNHDFEKLIRDSYTSGLFLRVSWQTEPNNFTSDEQLANNAIYIPFIADGNNHTYILRPNENEFFSYPGQFLQRMITNVSVDIVGVPATVTIDSLKIMPKYKMTR